MRAWWLGQQALDALAQEAGALLAHGRVQKVRQAAGACVVLEIHSKGTTWPLVLDAGAPVVRLSVAPPRREEADAPAFQGLLRKHLIHTRLVGITSHARQRWTRITLETLHQPLHLLMEWGDAPNVLLLHDNGVVMGAAVPALLRMRELRVGQPWKPQLEVEPVVAAAPAVDAVTLAEHALHEAPTHALLDLAGNPAAKPVVSPEATALRRDVKRALDGATRLLRALDGDLKKADGAHAFRTAAERANAQVGMLRKGAKTWTLKDPWDDSAAEITVDVDPAKGGRENVERLFHRAKRLERTRTAVLPRRDAAAAQVERMRAALAGVDAGTLDAAAQEAVRATLGLKQPAPLAGKTRGPQQRQPFRAFRTREGARVLVGKTREENDVLTHKTAKGNDVFLHARDAPGSHVILVVEGKEPPQEQALHQAALLAGHFSEARGHGVVDVRWTEVKHLKKVSGVAGLVTLAKERVRRVNLADPALAEMLAKEEGASSRL